MDNFDLSAITNSTDLLEEAIFGEVPRESWTQKFHAEFTLTEERGFSRNLTLEFALRIVSDPTAQTSKSRRLIGVNALLHLSEVEAIRAIGVEVAQIVRSLQTPRVLENDPRIGVLYSRHGTWLGMPLCDRTGLDPTSITLNPSRLIHAVKTFNGGYTPVNQVPCPLCTGARYADLVERAAHSPESVVWAGGNLGWAHRECTPWLIPRLHL